MRHFLSYFLSALLLLSSTFSPQYLHAEGQSYEDQPETSHIFGGFSLLITAAARLNATLFSAVPQLSTILRNQHAGLATQLLGISGLPFGSFQSMCSSIAGQVTSRMDAVLGPLQQVSNITGRLSANQSIVSLIPSLTSVSGIQLGNMNGLLTQATSLNGILSGGSFQQAFGGLISGKLASQNQVLSIFNASQSKLNLGGIRLGLDNALFRSIINTSGSHEISQLVAGSIPKMGILSQLDSFDNSLSVLGNIENRISSELVPHLNQLHSLAGGGDLASLANSVTQKLNAYTSEELSISTELGALTGVVNSAKQNFDILNSLTPLQRVEQFGPIGDHIDSHTRELQAMTAFLAERESQLQSLTQLEGQLFSKQNQLEFVRSSLAKYISLDEALTQLPGGQQADALLSMLDGYKDSAQSSIQSLLSAQDLLTQGRSLFAQNTTGLLQDALPLDSVLSQFEDAKGFIASQASETFAPLLEGATLFRDKLASVQDVVGSAFGSVSGTIQQGISQITDRFTSLQGGEFLSTIQGQIASLSDTLGPLQDQLSSVMGPFQDVMGDFGSASGLCDAAQSQLAGLLDGTDFSQLTGAVDQFFGGIRSQMTGYVSSLNSQLRLAMQPYCAGVSIPGLCSGAMYTPRDSLVRRLNRRQKQQRKQLKKCCKKFKGQIPQCEEPDALTCVQPDPQMRKVKGKKRKQRAKACYKVFRKQTRQCIKTFNRNPGISQVPTYPTLVNPEEITLPEELAHSMDQVDAYMKEVLDFSKAFPAQGLSLIYSNAYGYDPVALVQTAPQLIHEFLQDERYAEYR